MKSPLFVHKESCTLNRKQIYNVDSISSINLYHTTMLYDIISINCNKGPGLDGIYPKFIRECAYQLFEPLTIFFRKSLSLGTFPPAWKLANITLIHKSGPKNQISNYRPISKLSHFGKMFEKIATEQLTVLTYKFLPDIQHGFLLRRSVEANLFTYTSQIFEAMSHNLHVDSIYLDLKKAFDMLDHNILLHKLELIGLHGDRLRWLRSYVSNRSQAVTFHGYTSTFLPFTSVVLQGSHFSPLLFLTYTHDLPNCLTSSQIYLFVHDAKLYLI